MITKKIKSIIKYVSRKYFGYNLSTIKIKLGQDFLDQKIILSNQKIKTIFDVGSNTGQTTVKYKKMYPSADIYGFEPYTEAFLKYKDQFKGDKKVHGFNFALSDENGKRKFFVNNNHYTNSLFPIDIKEAKLMSNFKTVKEIEVTTQTVDLFCKDNNIQHIDILKLDVQGGEYLVLEGSKEMLAKNAIDIIFTEVEFLHLYENQPLFKDIEKFLKEYGYTLYRKYNVTHDENDEPIAGDVIFINHTMTYNSQYGQDRFLDQQIFKGMTDGLFLEMGADDGITFSNTLFFERERNWKGICVEPRKSAFEKLILNRRCSCENICISNEIKKKKFIEIEGAAGQLSGLAEKYDNKHLNKVCPEVTFTKEIEIDCITVTDLLNKFRVKKIDYFSLDVEGGELEILTSIDFNTITIDCISVENNYGDDSSVKNLLSTKGYRKCARVGIDDIYVLKNSKFDLYKEPFIIKIRRVYLIFKRVVKKIIRYDKQRTQKHK